MDFDKKNQEQIRQVIEYVEPLGKEVIVVSPRIKLRTPPVTFIERNLKMDFTFDSFIEEHQEDMIGAVRSVTDQYEHAYAVDGFAAQCRDRCSAFDSKGNILLADEWHLSYAGAVNFARGLEPQLEGLID